MQKYSSGHTDAANPVLISTAVKLSKAIALISLFLVSACGGSSSSPSGPGPAPTPVPGFGVSGVVFYDENANGILDASESVRLPGATIRIGGRSGQAEAEGRFTVSDVPAGSQSAQADPAGLPPYFAPGEPVTVSVPPQAGAEIAVPVVLAIGGNRANHYLAFGDSITRGVGGSEGGYTRHLRAELRSYWGAATIAEAGEPGTKSYQGEGRLPGELAYQRPAFTLILYGTNDWNDPRCRHQFECETVDALRSMILQARNAGSNPILGTIPPANPAWIDRGATERNVWVTRMNDLVRAMAQEEGVPIAEIHSDFMAQPSLRDLFDDHVHPNDAGYQIIARSWFNAITQPESAATAAFGAASGWSGFALPEAP
jgi:lysophospholipase L1-like esterase